MLRVAVYCRVARKDDFSLELQRNSLLQFSKSQGYEDVAVYLDNGVTGATFDRPALNQLTLDIVSGRVKTLFIKDYARLGRNYIELTKWLEMAGVYGAEVISQAEPPASNEQFKQTMRQFVKLQKHKRKANRKV